MGAAEIFGGTLLGMILFYIIAIACRFFIYKNKNSEWPKTGAALNIWTLAKSTTCATCPACTPTPCNSSAPGTTRPFRVKGAPCATNAYPSPTAANASTYKYDSKLNCSDVATCATGFFPVGNECRAECPAPPTGTPYTADANATKMVKPSTLADATCTNAVSVECKTGYVPIGGTCVETCPVPSVTIPNAKTYKKTGSPLSCTPTTVAECKDGFQVGTAGTAANTFVADPAGASYYTMKDLVEHYLMHG